MKEIINQRNANAHTLRYMCGAFVKKYKGKILSCMPVTRNGQVKSVKVMYKEPSSNITVPIYFHLDGADILESIENIELINFKIQHLCQEDKNTTN